MFVDNFIHYAPKILYRVDIWRLGSQLVFSIKFGRFLLYHAWVALAACAGAPSWTNVMCQEGSSAFTINHKKLGKSASNSGYKIRKIFGGKYTLACTPLARKCTD